MPHLIGYRGGPDGGRGMGVLSLDAPAIAQSVRAGQFVNLGWSPGPLLRRPFSVYRTDGDCIEVILKTVGTGTAQLLAMAPGDQVSCLGPLGHGFDLAAGPRTVALVSGGPGGGPMAPAWPQRLGGWLWSAAASGWRRCRSPRATRGRRGCT